MIGHLVARLLGRGAEPPELEAALAQAKARGIRRVILAWNRGLGDIALGVVGLVARIRADLPDAEVVVLTRDDLVEAFAMIPGVDVVRAVPGWRREPSRRGGPSEPWAVDAARRVGLATDGALVLPDVRWGAWYYREQVGRLVPRLRWRPEWEALARPLLGPADPGARRVAAHVDSETGHLYRYNKNWGAKRWGELFAHMSPGAPVRVFLLGQGPGEAFAFPFVTDLRGRTSLREALGVILASGVCVAPDSGLLTFAHFLDVARPLALVSLWANAEHGILRYGVGSPNPHLRHTALVGRAGDITTIDATDVCRALETAWARPPGG